MQDSTFTNLGKVMEQAAEEAMKAEKYIREEDGAMATKYLLRTITLTAEAIGTLSEFDGPLNALVNIAPNVQLYVNALELVSKRDFVGALQETRGKKEDPSSPEYMREVMPADLTKEERRVWLSTYAAAFAFSHAKVGESLTHIANLAVERLRARVGQ